MTAGGFKPQMAQLWLWLWPRACRGERRKCICADDVRPSAGHYGAFVSTQKPQTSIDDVARERSREAEINLATTYSSQPSSTLEINPTPAACDATRSCCAASVALELHCTACRHYCMLPPTACIHVDLLVLSFSIPQPNRNSTSQHICLLKENYTSLAISRREVLRYFVSFLPRLNDTGRWILDRAVPIDAVLCGCRSYFQDILRAEASSRFVRHI